MRLHQRSCHKTGAAIASRFEAGFAASAPGYLWAEVEEVSVWSVMENRYPYGRGTTECSI